MKKLGVTGGIGAGKSYVCRLLADEYGLPVYDCDREVDCVLYVDAPGEMRIARVMERDGSSRSQVMARIQSQTEKGCPDYVVMNDGTDLHLQLQTVMNGILK